MLTVEELRQRAAIVIPVYFDPSVEQALISRILESVLKDQNIFCRPDRTLIVVDRDSSAEDLLLNAQAESYLQGISVHSLKENRGKAGAIEAGLRVLVDTTDAEFFITRDCDGDHAVEDALKLVSMAADIAEWTGSNLVGVMGARPSLEKPMGWVREQWEVLTNRVLVELVTFYLARETKIIDRRFWSAYWPDIQSGYRVYSRSAAELTVQVLESLPDESDILTFACEFVPFAEILCKGGLFGQVQRMTLVEQPVSSYRQVDFHRVYGRLTQYVAKRLGVPDEVVLRIFDNHATSMSIYFTDNRVDIQRFRELLTEGAPGLLVPEFL